MPNLPYYLLLPLGGAVVYALASLIVKRALKEGVTMDQSFHLSNFCIGLIFLPLLLLETGEVEWREIGKPIAMGTVFFLGSWLTFLGIKRGDVSLVTPIMGTKVVFVALGVVLLTGKMPSVALWIASFLTALGIFVMGAGDFRKGRYLVFTVLITLCSALVFGLNDVLVSWWAESFGAVTFLAMGSLTVALLSGAMWLFQGLPSLRLSGARAKWAWWGAFFIGLQAMIIGLALSFFEDATGINVVYASRGLWVIALVVLFGSVLGNSEHRENGKAFLWRIAGTLLLSAAIVIAVVDRAKHPL